MIPVLDVSSEVEGVGAPGTLVAVSGGILSIVDVTHGQTQILVLRGLVEQVIAAWTKAPGEHAHSVVTTRGGNRFVVSVFDRKDGAPVLVIRTYAEAALGKVELDPEDVEVFERRERAAWLQ